MTGEQPELRERIARVLDYPASFDAPTFTEWKQQMADAVLAALGLVEAGWSIDGDPFRCIHDDCVHDHASDDRWFRVYRLRAQS